MTVQCSWCKSVRVGDRWYAASTTAAVIIPGTPVSHGICGPCEAKYFPRGRDDRRPGSRTPRRVA
jgi:hypothetical protein